MLIRIRVPDRVFESRAVAWMGSALGAAYPWTKSASCPDCGTVMLRRLKKRDATARNSSTLWVAVHRFFGGKLFLCDRCRLQFFDCRPLRETPTSLVQTHRAG